MAVPAARRFNVATERTQLGVEGVAIRRELVFVARPADRRGLHTKGGFCRLQNGMGGMAVRADRRLELACGDRLAVRTLFVVRIDLGMAGPAGLGDVGLEGWALRIGVTANPVRTVAALAVRRDKQAFFAERKAMNGVDVMRIDAG